VDARVVRLAGYRRAVRLLVVGTSAASVERVRYRFGTHALDTDTLELLDGADAVEVEPQVFEVLAHLLANRDRVVPKEELLDQVWGDRFVSESALTTRIKQARQAVGDNGRDQAVIKTFHGRGYRFVADVSEGEPERVSAERAAPPITPAVSAIPRTHYAESDGASIAYQTFGEGPELVFIAGFGSNVEVQWEHPAMAAFLRRLGSFCRVTVLDKRGTGLSDRMPRDDPPSLETRADDLLAVMDAAGIERATILGSSEGGSLSALFTAAHPDRVERLILHNTWVQGGQMMDLQPDALDIVSRAWGKGSIYAWLAPTLASDRSGREFLGRYEKQSATPRAARHLLELSYQIDLTSVLAAVATPTLVLHRRGDVAVHFRHGEQLAAGIPGARLVALEGADHAIFSGADDPFFEAVEDFVTGTKALPPSERFLATVLFVDIVASTEMARTLGDAQWTRRLDEFLEVANRTLIDHRGDIIKTTGDGLLATFEGPGRGVQAACALRSAVTPLGLKVRAGLHTAEIERRGDDVAGLGVHIASRVAEKADPGEVWVSRTVTDLVAGTGLRFAERGTHELKGLDHPWALFEALG
jgi:pimeloyl-ACP methyl ester carboxylesterase